MADHGQRINSRTYWTWTGPDGKQASGPIPPGGPNAPFGLGSKPPPAVQYQEETYADGTKVLSHFDPTVGEKGDWVQDSVEVDPQLRQQHKDEAAATAPEKPTEVGGKIVQRQPNGTYTVVYDPATAGGAPKPIEVGGQIVQQQPDGSVKVIWSPPAKGAIPGLQLPAPRAGQRTDLSLVESQANAYLATLNADTSLTPEDRNRRWQTYLETTVRPAQEQANREITAEMDRVQRQQTATQERQTSTAEQSARLAGAQFEYGAGQDAVKNAISLLQYQHNPAFLKAFADATGTLSRGGGAVSIDPSAFQIQGPDINALAEQGAQRAAAMYRTQAGVPFSPRPGPAGAIGPGPGAISSSSGATQAALQQAPFTPRPAPGALPPPVLATPSAYPSATPGVPVGTPSPLPPGWEQFYPQPSAY